MRTQNEYENIITKEFYFIFFSCVIYVLQLALSLVGALFTSDRRRRYFLHKISEYKNLKKKKACKLVSVSLFSTTHLVNVRQFSR